MAYQLFRYVLVFGYFPFIILKLISSLISLLSENTLHMISVHVSLISFVSWPRRWLLIFVFCVHLKRIGHFAFDGALWIGSNCLMVSPSTSLLISSLFVPLNKERSVEFPNCNCGFVSPFSSSIGFCFIVFL